LIPAALLQKEGFRCKIITEHTPQLPDVLIVGKTIDPNALQMITECKAAGKRVIVDACDDARGTVIHDQLIQMCQVADCITVSTPTLRDLFKTLYGLNAVVVDDCIEGIRKPPAFLNKPPSLLWFGHATNLAGLREAFEPIQNDCELTICTNDIRKTCEIVGVKARYAEWDLETQMSLLDECDAVLITSAKGDRGAVKSPNRVITSLWAGKPVICEPLPSYLELKDFAYVGHIPSQFGRMMREEPEQRIHKGQEFILESYGQAHKKWAKVILGD